MIVQCQKCQTKFKLPDEKVPSGGMKVRCGKCGATFRVARPAQRPADESTRIAPSSIIEGLEKKEAAQRAAARRPAAHAPATAAPAPQIAGEKREFQVPEMTRTPSTIFGADKPASGQVPSVPSSNEFAPTPEMAAEDPGFFGNETVVAPMGDFDAMTGRAPAPAGLAPTAPAPRPGTAEFDIDTGPELPGDLPSFVDGGPPAAPAPGHVAAQATSVIDELFENQTRVVQHEALKGLDPQALPPAKRPISGEKKEFVVPIVPHGRDPAFTAPTPASVPEHAGDGGDLDVDSLFSGLFVPDGHEAMPPPARAVPVPEAPFAGVDIEPDMGTLREMPVPDLGVQGSPDDVARWSDMGADLIGGSGIDPDQPASATAPQQPPAADPSAGVAAIQDGGFNDDLAKSLQDEINRQFEMHFGESPGEVPQANVQFDAEARPQPAGFGAGPAPAPPPPPAGQPGTRQPITDNPFAAPFQVGIGTNDIGDPAQVSLPPVPVSDLAFPDLDTFGPAGGASNPFLQMPAPISSADTMTAPPGPGSNDFLPSVPQVPPAPASDPFAGFDLGAPVGKAPQADPNEPGPGKFAGTGQPVMSGLGGPGLGGGNDLFAQLEAMGGDRGPGIGPQIEQLPVRQGDPNPAFAVTGSGFDLDQSGGAVFIQQQAGVVKPPTAAAESIDLHQGALQQARPGIARQVTSGVVTAAPSVASRKEAPKGPFAAAMPWVFTVLLLVAAISLLGLRNGKLAPGNIIKNLTPATAGSLNKYSIQGFKLYTVQSGRKVGVVTGNVKADGAVNPAAIKIGFSLSDHAGYTAFRGEFFPAKPLTPEEIYELKSADEATATLSARRLTTIDGRWIPFQAIFFDPPEHLDRFAFHIEVSGVP